MPHATQIPQAIIKQMQMHFESCYPDEGCGLLTGTETKGVRVALEFHVCQNLQNTLHAQDPRRYPRTAKNAYSLDPKEWTICDNNAQAAGQIILAIVHSHPDHGIYFSDEDKAMAAPWGEPLMPGISYIVVGINQKKMIGLCEYMWDITTRDFVAVTKQEHI